MPFIRPTKTTVSAPIPSWAPAVGLWGTVPGGSLDASGVGWAGTSPGGSGGYETIFTAWGGGIYNTTGIYNGSTFVNGDFLCVFGGGHTDYAGNEIYAFGPIMSESGQAWYRLRDPTVPGPSNVSEDGSGNPVSRHTYSSFVYLPASNRLFCNGGVIRYIDAGAIPVTHVFNFNTANPNSNQPWQTLSSVPQQTNVACYDSVNNGVWSTPGGLNRIQFYDIAGDTYTDGGFNFKSPTFGANPSAAIDQNRQILAIYGDSALNFFRTNNGTNPNYYVPTTTGTAPANQSRAILWDDINDWFAIWDGSGNTWTKLTPPASNPFEGGNAWTYSTVTGTGATVGSGQVNGTYGRWGLIKRGSARFYALLNSNSQSMFIYRAA